MATEPQGVVQHGSTAWDEFRFLISRPGGFWRYDVWPFVTVLYPMMIVFSAWSGFWQAMFTDGAWDESIVDLIDVSELIDEEYLVREKDFEWASVCFVFWIILCLVHIFCYLFTHWNVNWRLAMQYEDACPTLGVDAASHVYVVPAKKGETGAICKVETLKIDNEKCVPITKYSLEHNKKKLIWNKERKTFEEVDSPIDLPLWKYITPQGLNPRDVANAKAVHGAVNNYDIVLPTFMQLFKEHALAPFFVFQMVTMLLWMLDDMWQYSLFTMMTLVGMECQVVFRRQKEMTQMTDMKIPPRKVMCYRADRWISLSSEDIVPGDIISLKGGKSSEQVPADLLLLRGGCLINESILTGESVPQMKVDFDSIINIESALTAKTANTLPMELERCLDIEGQHKSCILHAGTKVISHQARTVSEDGEDEPKNKLKKNTGVFDTDTPDGGALCYVLRTGFATSQGQLVRTIFYSTERVTADSREAFCYLGILLIVALIAAGYVFWHEMQNSGRSKFKLVLSCILIITSVVPPEFPITMSMAVQMSLVQLLKMKIYCTEPFRVPFAGRLKYCAFDKTGTLTSDKLYLRGIVGLPSKKNGIVELLPPMVDEKKLSKTSAKDASPTANVDLSAQIEKRNKSVFKHELKQSLPFLTSAVLGLCHSLLLVTPEVDDDEITNSAKLGPTLKAHKDRPEAVPEAVGDPMELACFKALGWELKHDNVVESVPTGKATTKDVFKIVRRFPFSSELQRMMVIAKVMAGSPKSPVVRICDSYDDQVDLNASTLSGTKAASNGSDVHLALIKGSYEMIRTLCKVPPSAEVDALADRYMRQGLRVIGLAARHIEDHAGLVKADRKDLERDFIFCGLACLDCPLKADTAECIDKLIQSSHKVSMITGDNPLTAAQVAKDCHIIPNQTTPVYSLESISGETLHFKNLLSPEKEPLSVPYQELKKESKSKAFVVTGKKMTACFEEPSASVFHSGVLEETPSAPSTSTELIEDMFTIVAQNAAVFARVSPSQKKALLLAMNREGDHTLMCGDGTNDTGALKAAKVGISLVSGGPETKEEKQKQLEQYSSSTDPSASVLRLADGTCVTMPQLPPHIVKEWMKIRSQKMLAGWFKNEQLEKQISDAMVKLLSEIQSLKDSDPDALLRKSATANPKLNADKQAKAIEDMQSKLTELAEDDLPTLKLGDASIASPFAYKGTSIKCVPLIIQYGRASVVTVMMQYMIMALNALTTALMLSVLSLDGVKFSDRQYTVQALFLVGFNFQCSRPPPATTISPRKPIDSIFDPTFLCSWFGQSLVHLTCIAAAWSLAFSYRDANYDPDVDGDFKPNLLNTTMWLVMTIMHGTTFVANYPGSPFVASWEENGTMKNGLVMFMGGILLLATEWMPELNEMIYLVPLPSDTYKYALLCILSCDFLFALAVSKGCNQWQIHRDAVERANY